MCRPSSPTPAARTRSVNRAVDPRLAWTIGATSQRRRGAPAAAAASRIGRRKLVITLRSSSPRAQGRDDGRFDSRVTAELHPRLDLDPKADRRRRQKVEHLLEGGNGLLGPITQPQAADLVELQRRDRPRSGRRPLEGRIVQDDEPAVGGSVHVELDLVGAGGDRVAEGGPAVLGHLARPAAMGGDQRSRSAHRPSPTATPRTRCRSARAKTRSPGAITSTAPAMTTGPLTIPSSIATS